METSVDSLIRCDYCRGVVPGGETECPRCGAPLPTGSQLSDLTLEGFVEASHQKLIESGTSAAELAFGVGCTLCVLVALILMVIIFFAFTRVWTSLAVYLLILTLISFLVSSILASRAREATTRKTFQREVEPEIETFTARRGITHDEFIHQAGEILPASSPLLLYSARQRGPD